MKLWLQRVHRFLVDTVVAKALVPAALFVAYFAGVGLTSLAVRVLKPSLLRSPRRSADSGWVPAAGYEADMENCRRQS